MQSPGERRLTSWKEIAAFFGRGVRTVKRWENERGLPVHRLPGRGGASIYAIPSELGAWLNGAETDPPARAEPRWENRPILIAGAVTLAVLALGLAGLAWRQPVAAPRRPHDPRAVELYLEGVHDWNTRSPEGLRRAQDEFTQAIVTDPGYAQAYAGLANTYNLLREYAGMPDARAYPLAEAAALRAIALDPGVARAHASLGFVLYYWRWDSQGADHEFRKAVRLDPRDPLIHHWYANVLRSRGRAGEALREIVTAQTLDADSSAILADKGQLLLTTGRAAEGRQILARMEAVDPSFMSPHVYLAAQDLAEGDYAAWLIEQQAMADLHRDPGRDAVLAAARAGLRAGGPRAMLAAMLRAQRRLYERGEATAYPLAQTAMLMGDEAGARAWLRIAVARHDPRVIGARGDPAMAPLSRAAEFASLRHAVWS